MDTEDVRTLIAKLQGISIDMDAEALSQVFKACSIIEQMTAQQCRNVISLAGNRPCLLTFMSDGWSTDLRTTTQDSADGVHVRRPHRLRSEFVMQRTIVKTLVGSEVVMGIKMERPRLLAAKKCVDVWSAACDTCPLLKLFGHSGISVSVYLQDGLFAKPFGRLMHARHSLFFEKDHCPMGGWSDHDREMADLKDLVFAFTCCAHACSRALKWGLKHLMVGGDDMLEDVHVSISALMRASTGLSQVVPEFIAGFVDFDRPEPSNTEEIAQFWAFFDIDHKHIDLFIKVNPVWTGKKLRVSASLINDPGCMAALKTIINYCLRFCDFSDTRWTKVGVCGRFWVRALVIGVDKLVELAMKDDAVCRYHLKGYQKKCTPQVRTYLAVAACAARPSETMLIELLEDDRFLADPNRYWQVMVDEFQYLSGCPGYFWSTLADVLAVVDPITLRAHVVESSLVSIAYLHLECWAPLAQAPLKYIIGDVVSNIQALKLETDVTDPVAVKMQTLTMIGFEDDVVAACLLTRETSLTTTLVEQAHASGAMISKKHPQLEQAQLVARMSVHNCRALFSPGRFEKQLLLLNHLLEQLDYQIKNAHRAGAREMYVKLLISQVKSTRSLDGPSEHAIRRSIFKHHAKTYSDLSPAQIGVLSLKAKAHIKHKIGDLSQSKEHIQARLSLLHTRQAELKAKGFPNHIESVSFGAEEFDRFGELWVESEGSVGVGQIQPPPGQVPAALGSLIQDKITAQTVDKPPKPEWVSSFLTLRDALVGCAFYSGELDIMPSVIYRLLLCICQPQRTVFLECQRVSPAQRPSLYNLPSGVSPEIIPQNDFYYKSFRFVDHTQVPWKSLSDIWVLPECLWAGSSVTVTTESVPWSVFVRYSKPVAAPRKQQSQEQRLSRTPIADDILLAVQLEFPWLTLSQIRDMLQAKTSCGSGGGGQAGQSNPGSSASSSRPVTQDVPEDVLAQVHSDLNALRTELAEADEPTSQFKIRVLGGPWSQKMFGKTVTDVGCYAKDRTTETWCLACGWPSARSFAVTKFRGIDNCRMLAEEVRRKGDYFYQCWLNAGSPAPFSFDDCHHGYRTTDAYSDWFDELIMSTECSKAAFQLRGMCPRPLPA